MIEELDLLDAKPVVTPGTGDVAPSAVDEGAAVLDTVRATSYRALAARANYIEGDRADAQIAVKELCREMSSPTEESRSRLKRVVRYPKGRPRAVTHLNWQN